MGTWCGEQGSRGAGEAGSQGWGTGGAEGRGRGWRTGGPRGAPRRPPAPPHPPPPPAPPRPPAPHPPRPCPPLPAPRAASPRRALSQAGRSRAALARMMAGRAFLPPGVAGCCARCDQPNALDSYLLCDRCRGIYGWGCFRDTAHEMCISTCPGCHVASPCMSQPEYCLMQQ
jgi:hypothetical protein